MAATLAILYIIIIALAGLGIVVVKALGGEEIPLKAGTVLVYPGRSADDHVILEARRARGSTRSRPGPPTGSARPRTSRWSSTSRSNWPFPAGSCLKANPRGSGLRPARAGTAAGAGQLVGHLHHRLHDPDRALRRLVHVPPAQGQGRRGLDHRRGAVLGATVLGALVPGSALEPYFSLSRDWTVFALAAYGFVAAVLPVWLLLCPRDYLSSFLKIGTIFLLVAGVIVANPKLEAPPVSPHFAAGGGPYFDGPIFPYVFICIMCGAISGFHSLVSSGTTPKMVNRESDIRMIGYGAMLMEGLVGVVALIAAAALPNSMYYDINIDLGKRPTFLASHPDFAQFLKASEVDLHGGHGRGSRAARRRPASWWRWRRTFEESLHGRTGGAVTLAVGMARIFSNAMPGPAGPDRLLVPLRDHVRGAVHPDHDRRRDADRAVPGAGVPGPDLEAAGQPGLAARRRCWPPGWWSCGWGYFIYTGSVETIWPMFGMANQLLAVIALAVVTTGLVNAGRGKYAPVTLLPMLFVATTTSTTGYYEITGKFWNMIQAGRGGTRLAQYRPYG